MTLKRIVRRIPWSADRSLRIQLWDVQNNPARTPEQAAQLRSLLRGELHAMVVEEGRGGIKSGRPFGREMIVPRGKIRGRAFKCTQQTRGERVREWLHPARKA